MVSTAALLAEHMKQKWATGQLFDSRKGIRSITAVDIENCNLPIIFNALGLMLVLELSSYAKVWQAV